MDQPDDIFLRRCKCGGRRAGHEVCSERQLFITAVLSRVKDTNLRIDGRVTEVLQRELGAVFTPAAS